jgi:beta-mannosidase
MPARVPGTVHQDLLINKKIPDPFYGTNEHRVQWIDTQRWIYRRAVNVPSTFLRHPVIELVAEGLDTYAEVRCNGKRVSTTSNMFRAHRVDLRKALRPGGNIIEIAFDSPTLRSQSLERKHGRLQVALESHRVYVRKAQYAFGWDWGPKLTTSGIWLPIRLEGYTSGRLYDPHVQILSVTQREARVKVTVGVHRFTGTRLTLHAVLIGDDRTLHQSVQVDSSEISFFFVVKNPRLWWPNGSGDQPIYAVVLTVADGKGEVHTIRVPFGIRTVRLLQKPDRDGRSFIFEINGRKVFCKGADWIPADTFLPRVTLETYERLLTLARDASMNMIRVWGGGVYEREIFYHLCDRLGLMVWQDFMFACGEYPDGKEFVKEVRSEAEEVVKRLRNHPSLVLWCGNNECEWIYCMANPTRHPDDMRGAAIFRDVLPAVLRAHDRSRPFWRSTPYGRGFPNSENDGNHHQWEVWSGWKDYREYEKNRARFVSEFGFQAPANSKTLQSVIAPADRWPQSAMMEHHNKQVEGPERLYRFQAAHFVVGRDWDEFIYKAQLVQAEALRCAAEHWRRHKFHTAGVLFWQLNDCWPVISWSVIDSHLRPKAAYFYAKRFFAPVLVSFRRHNPGIEVWGTNDLFRPIRARLLLTLRSFRGKTLWRHQRSVIVPANASRLLYRLSPKLHAGIDPTTSYVLAELLDGKNVVSENRFLFMEPKQLSLPRATIRCDVVSAGRGYRRIVLRSGVFAKDVRLAVQKGELDLHDNYRDLDPGVPRSISIRSDLPPRELKRRITVTALNS